MADIKKFQDTIGYHFNNEALLIQALTHSSYANEKHMKKLSDNERLEFLGDAVRELTSSEFLFENYKKITRRNAKYFKYNYCVFSSCIILLCICVTLINAFLKNGAEFNKVIAKDFSK